ncbi:hypothetical protein CDD83_3720 [Cordyceps sp. RAO-2017]|nr:hypothetical protein CDD83_3720 [Cordyceps sp. RAO-2017]
MSHLRYYNYEKQGVEMNKNFYFSQAVRVGDYIESSGQGGWDPTTGKLAPDAVTQIEQAFANVERCLRDAGGKGWSQVFKVQTFHVGLDEATCQAVVRCLKKYMPDHQPTWTCLGIKNLALEEMLAEVQVVAHDPEGAKVAESA